MRTCIYNGFSDIFLTLSAVDVQISDITEKEVEDKKYGAEEEENIWSDLELMGYKVIHDLVKRDPIGSK